jgi:hypothetical protein
MPDEENELKRATQHIAAAEQIVAEQRRRIGRLEAGGHPTAEHQRLLELFISTLEAFKDHERLLASEVAEKKTHHSK